MGRRCRSWEEESFASATGVHEHVGVQKHQQGRAQQMEEGRKQELITRISGECAA